MSSSLEDIQAAIAKHGSKRAAARALGVDESTLRKKLARSIDRKMIGAPPMVELPEHGFVVKRNSVSYDKDGKLSGQHITTAAGPGEIFVPIPGHMIKGESAYTNAEGKLLGKWTKTREGAIGAGLIEALESVFEKYAGKASLVLPPAVVIGELHTIYPLADLHIGMYSWGQETGDDYDVDIAVRRVQAAYQSLIGSSAPSKTATLLNLGDFFHANDARFVTPGHGHLLDVDGRHPRVLEAGADLLVTVVDLLLQKHEQVELVCLAGNHDPDATAALRVAMRLFYRGHPRVMVDNSPRLAWYRRFGKNLFGATHSHTAKMADVAGMMAVDRPQDWGLTEYRSYFTGHIHHERALEKAGVRAESFQTLASRDAFAAHGPWRSGNSIQSILFHHDDGEIFRSRVNVLAASHKQTSSTITQ